MIASKRKQLGVTLIELMVGLVLGLVVVGMVSSMYISTTGILGQTTSTIRLNGELRTVNELISRSVKRAGYWNSDEVASNPHASIIEGGMQIGLFSSSTAWASQVVSNADCFVVSYDADNSGTDSPVEVFGVRASGAILQITSTVSVAAGSTVTCASLSWEDLSDGTFLSVDNFTLSYEPALGSIASVAELSGKGVLYEITAHVIDDTNITQTVSGAVQLRNSSFW